MNAKENSSAKQLYPSYAPPKKWRTESQTRFLEGEEWQAIRRRTLQRDDYKCAYCGYRAKKYQIVDHIDGDPENHSGDNLQVVCQMCNCVKHAGQGCVVKGIVELYRFSWFSQNTLIILTRFLRDSGKSDEEIKKLLGFNEEVEFEMDREYLKPLLAFVTSRPTHSGNEGYDRWRNYHEQFVRPKYLPNIEKHLLAIPPDLYDGLYEQVKVKVLAYISELSGHQDKPVLTMLVEAGMVKKLVREGLIRFSEF